MKPLALTLVGLRILAVYLASQSFLYMASAVPVIMERLLGHADPSGLWDSPIIWSILLSLSAPLIVGILLWMAAPQLARWTTRRFRPDPIGDVPLPALATAAYTVTGVVLIATALPYAALELLRIWNAHAANLPVGEHVAFLVANAVRCLLGAALVLGRNGLRRLLFTLRYRGSSAAPHDTDTV